jgi:hypothetical protein
MKFIFADAIDQIDPHFNFLLDESPPERRPHRDDLYPHEVFKKPPYDGVLISRAIVGDSSKQGKYSGALAMRLGREGARSILRMERGALKAMPIFGDCGAFSYVAENLPPYSGEDMAHWYENGRFTHGCSPDHIIFGYDTSARGLKGASDDEMERFEITQSNAREFWKHTKAMTGFTPMGAVQGWSPESMAIAAKNLEKMGYRYLAIGGMVPLSAEDILLAIQSIRAKIKPSTQLHILGFAKAESIHQFRDQGISSFDSTSPLIRAFKDARSNYYVDRGARGLDYYTAIRVPQATENRKLVNGAREGKFTQESVTKLEKHALKTLRAFDTKKATAASATSAVLDYLRVFLSLDYKTNDALDKALVKSEQALGRTLTDAPWKTCGCEVCKASGIETMIFRTSNRNKRRGFHNLHVYHEHLKKVRNGNK